MKGLNIHMSWHGHVQISGTWAKVKGRSQLRPRLCGPSHPRSRRTGGGGSDIQWAATTSSSSIIVTAKNKSRADDFPLLLIWGGGHGCPLRTCFGYPISACLTAESSCVAEIPEPQPRQGPILIRINLCLEQNIFGYHAHHHGINLDTKIYYDANVQTFWMTIT